METKWNPMYNFIVFRLFWQFNIIIKKTIAKEKWCNDWSLIVYFLINDLQWMSIEFGDNLFNVFWNNKTNVLSFSWQIFMKLKWFCWMIYGMDKHKCTACWIDICCAFKNAFSRVLKLFKCFGFFTFRFV